MSQTMSTVSPNTSIMPITAGENELNHLVVGGCDTVELAERFGTPLWVLDEATIRQAARACQDGLKDYPDWQVLFAGKAFLCTAMVHLVKQMGLGLDVVSDGELYTARKADFPPHLLYLHGNNKSAIEIEDALKLGPVKIVADSESEIAQISQIARNLGVRAKLMLRVTPGVEPDTHEHIKTGQRNSKFGFPLHVLDQVVQNVLEHKEELELVGLHAHIGSQTKQFDPYWRLIEILADLLVKLRDQHHVQIAELDVGGGLGITYTDEDEPVPIYAWAQSIAQRSAQALSLRGLPYPKLVLEPGRCIVGTAGLTLYRAGHSKTIPNTAHYLSLDGGMVDNPRPIMYQARYTAKIASRINAEASRSPTALVGRYCESGDIIVKEAYLPAESGDLIAIFGTGAYNYSMASNYNRTPRPACVLVANGEAEIIIERETNDDLVSHDRVPPRLLGSS